MINEGKRGFKVRHKQKVASIEPSKPRNFVAKNAINTGAGAHKDKKKAMKQGDTKHKKDYAEGMEEKFQAQLDMLNEIKKGQKDSNGYSSCWTGYHAAGTKKGKNGGRVRNCVPNEDVEEGYAINENSDVLAGLTDILKMAASRQAPQNPRYFAQQVKDVALQLKDNPATQKWSNYLDGVVRWADVISSGKEQYSSGFANEVHSVLGPATRAYQDALLNKQGVAEGIKGAIAGGAAGALLTKTPSGAMAGADIGDKLGDMVETTDSEGGMAKQQLITAAKLAIQLAQQMDSDTQLDAWVQTKISLASDYLSTVHEFLVNGEQDVDKEEETDEEVIPGITHQHQHGTLKHTSTTMEGAKVDRQAKHITKSMMKAHPGMSKEEAEGAAWAHIKHPKKKKKMKEDAYDIYLEVMLGKKLDK